MVTMDHIRRCDEIFRRLPQLLEYPERVYLLQNFLARANGLVLSVGCEEYNQFDYMALPPGAQLTTIDSNPEKQVFGSPNAHIVADFLSDHAFDDGMRFSFISLFGVLGEDDLDAFYTLGDRSTEALDRAIALLKPGGRLLVAPNCSSRRWPFENRVRFWWWRLRLRRWRLDMPQVALRDIEFFTRNPIFIFELAAQS